MAASGSGLYLHAIHGHGGQVVGVLFVPAEAEQRVVLWVLVDDGAVLQVPEVKHADGSVSAHGGKHVSSASCTAERDVVHLPTETAVSTTMRTTTHGYS